MSSVYISACAAAFVSGLLNCPVPHAPYTLPNAAIAFSEVISGVALVHL